MLAKERRWSVPDVESKVRRVVFTVFITVMCLVDQLFVSYFAYTNVVLLANDGLAHPRPIAVNSCRAIQVSNPTGVRGFALSPCGPISFLGLSLRRYYLGYFAALQDIEPLSILE